MDEWTIVDAWDLITYRLCHSGPLVKKTLKQEDQALEVVVACKEGRFNCLTVTQMK